MTRILTTTGFVALTFAALIGCGSDSNFTNKPPTPVVTEPNIVVSPVSLEFGTLTSVDTETQTFEIKSIGEVPLTVDDITIDGSAAFRILSDTFYELQPDESVTIEVEFAPLQVDNSAFAVVHSDDPDEPESLVQLTGFGTVPELTITPPEHDFGTRFIPCDDDLTLNLQNTGGDLLTIEAIGHLSDGDYVLTDNNTLPLTLAPGESTTVDLVYTPTIEGTTTGTLQVLSNDPRGLVEATQTGTAQYAAFTTDTHSVPIDPPVDILFAVDQSCSMDTHSTNLAQNFSAFINQIDTATNGWRIGVADVGTADQPGGPAGCFVNGYIESTTPNYASAFTTAVGYGSDPGGYETYSERLTELVDIALSKTAPGACNSGFLRPGALLHVVLVSDEPDYSSNPWTYYLGNYETYVVDPTLLKVSGILNLNNFGCGADGAGTYPDIVNATGGVQIDICGSWASQLGNLGAASLNGVSNFELNNPADGASIQVTVNGAPRFDWNYNQAANEVQFDAPLEGGDEVVIEYGIAVACPN